MGYNGAYPMHARVLFPALLALLLLALLPGTAGAITCSYPATTYTKDAAGVRPAGGPTTGDPLAPAQWGLNQIKAPGAWARGARGAGVTIAVLDTGADLSHPDLKDKLLLPGKDYVTNGDQCAGPQDENGHGSHVTGIAAAATGNGTGTAGVAPDARVMPVRVLDAEGAEPELGVVFEAIRWAADNGADVINLSLADLPLLATLDGSDAEAEAAVAHAWSKGAVVVSAASNEAFPLCNYPAAASRAICVGATDAGGFPTYYSNFPNSPSDGVGVRAPGGEGSPIFCEYDGDVWSTVWPGDAIDSLAECDDVRGYETFAGTSMAAPHVSGVAALLAGRGLTNAQIFECIRTTSSNDGDYDPVYGYGIVNADNAVAKCAPHSTPPFQPGGGGGGGENPPPGGGGGGGGGGGDNSGEAQVTVTVKKTTRAKLARSGRLVATIRTDRAATVKLRAVLVRGGKKSTAGARTVELAGAGTKKAGVRLSKSARRRLASSSRYRLVLRWRSGSKTGSATASR
jgi:subtilisin family serine protease